MNPGTQDSVSPRTLICCGYSLEVPCQGAFNEYPQHMFLCRNEKNIGSFWIHKASYLEL